MKRIVFTIFWGLQPAVIAAIGGFDFHVGDKLAFIYFACLYSGGFAYAYPGWEKPR